MSKAENNAAASTAQTPFLPTIRPSLLAEREAAPLAATSKGLPPPPNASGLVFAASVRWASEVMVVATPLLTAVVGWKVGEGEGSAVVSDDDDEVVVVEVGVFVSVSVSLVEDVDAAEPSSLVDEGAGAPLPWTLFGHRYSIPLSAKNSPIKVSGLARTPAHALLRLAFTSDNPARHCREQTPLPEEVIRPVMVISDEVQEEMSAL